jgi:hypothetical protein
MLCVWNVKGGSGCSVVSAGLALLATEQRPAVLVDLAGELPAVLGVELVGPGIADWLVAPEPPPDALSRMERSAAANLSLLQLGSLAAVGGGIGQLGGGHDGWADRLRLLARLLAAEERQVVVDIGTGVAQYQPVLDAAQSSILVIRACYLAVSRAARERCPDGIVVVREPGRALRSADIEDAVGAPVVATVPWDPAVARAVDAGLLARRLPKPLRQLRTVALTGGSVP